MKYLFILKLFSSVSIFIHSGIMSVIESLFWRNIISEVTVVPALSLNTLLGSLIAPIKSALLATYFLTSSFFLSINPWDVINAIIPPGLTLSMAFAKK